jgi:hypothetical protein
MQIIRMLASRHIGKGFEPDAKNEHLLTKSLCYSIYNNTKDFINKMRIYQYTKLRIPAGYPESRLQHISYCNI